MEALFRAYFMRVDPESSWLSDPVEDELVPSVIFGEEVEDGLRRWRPVYASELEQRPSLSFLGGVHSDVSEYFLSAYFGDVAGSCEGVEFSLFGLFPETLAEDFVVFDAAERRVVAIGLQYPSDLQVVLDLATAEVGIWDWERGVVDVFASSIRELVASLAR